MRVLSNLGVDMTNVHAAGGVEMMKAAREGLGQGPKLIAVTQLTSTSEEQMKEDQNIRQVWLILCFIMRKKLKKLVLMALSARLARLLLSKRQRRMILFV